MIGDRSSDEQEETAVQNETCPSVFISVNIFAEKMFFLAST